MSEVLAASRGVARSTSGSLILATGLALLLGAGLIVAVGVNPADAYGSLWSGSVGSWDALAQTSLRMTPLLVMAIGLIPALRAGIFTLGSEAQFGIGALAAGLATLAAAPHLPAWLTIVVAALSGCAGGVGWALVPALLRAFLSMDEILTTFAFNFIASTSRGRRRTDLQLWPASTARTSSLSAKLAGPR